MDETGHGCQSACSPASKARTTDGPVRWRGRDSNPRFPAYETGEMPLLYPDKKSCGAVLLHEWHAHRVNDEVRRSDDFVELELREAHAWLLAFEFGQDRYDQIYLGELVHAARSSAARGIGWRLGWYCEISSFSLPPLAFSARAAAVSGMISGQVHTACRVIPSALAVRAWLPKNLITSVLFMRVRLGQINPIDKSIF